MTEVLLEAESPCWVTRRSLQAFIRDTTGMEVTRKDLSRLCQAWGLEYGRLRRPSSAVTPKRSLQRDVALCQLRRAITGKHLIYAADESYANANHTFEDSFHIAGSPFATFARAKGCGLGERLCFIQAVGMNGLAGMPDDLVAVVGDIDTPQPHGEMMFAAKKKVGSYHGNFTHPIFIKWLLNRLVPWAQAAHPGLLTGAPGSAASKLCLMLDNAPYHTGSSEHLVAGPELRFNPLSSTKGVLFEGMAKAGCASLNVSHSYTPVGAAQPITMVIAVAMTDAGAAMRGKKGVFPSAEEVQLAAQAWLMDNRPQVLENDAEAILRTHLNGNAYILWNAPNFPELMPIELVWAASKAFTAVAWTGKRNMVRLAADVHQGLYTDTVAMPGVLQTRGGHFVPGADGSCPTAAALFEHVLHSPRGGAMRHIAESTRLQGTMADLTVPGELLDIVGTIGRNAMLYKQAQLLAAGGGVPGEALEEEEEGSGGEE